jgi:GNAT superfamily N-acetyltransferase
LLGELERRSGELFADVGIYVSSTVTVADRAELPLAAFVAGEPPVGFVWLTLLCGHPHIEQVSVLREHGRKGIGRGLVEAGCRWAAEVGYGCVTLCTFRDVPWNGPFYRSAGFVELEEREWCDELRAVRDTERAHGLDDLGARVVMIRDLVRAPAT